MGPATSSLRVQQWIREAPTNFLIEFPDTERQLEFLLRQTDPGKIKHAISQLCVVPLTPENIQKQQCRTYMVRIMHSILSANQDESMDVDEINEIEIEAIMEDVVTSVSSSNSSTDLLISNEVMPLYSDMDDDALRALMESNGMKSRSREVMIGRLTDIWKQSVGHKQNHGVELEHNARDINISLNTMHRIKYNVIQSVKK